MNMLDIIIRKKNKEALSYDELKYAFNNYLSGKIPDYQMSALLMAITINDMNMSETLALTDIFIRSGETYDLSSIAPHVVDKHSTGGVGDSTTLVVGPICAALGLKMAKMSGRGLGLTGGTIDKVESIPGFIVNESKEDFFEQVRKNGFALSSQSDNLVPLDKVIYALRDVTGTTESIPLIASSIMSKKIALGATDILIDIKVGSGALLHTKEEAEILSKWLIDIGDAYHRKVETILSDMNEPLSFAIGNALEVKEAINVLNGKRSPLFDTAVEIAARLLTMVEGTDEKKAQELAIQAIDSGAALTCFNDFVTAQGGDLSKLKVSDKVIKVKAKKDGIIESIDALGAAKLAAKLGATKKTLDDKIDYGVGILLKVKKGDHIKKNDVLMELYVKNYNEEFHNGDFAFIEIV